MTKFNRVIDRFPDKQKGKSIKEFSSYKGNVLAGLDGAQYFGSEKISCSNCSCRKNSKGKKRYYHRAVPAARVNPDQSHVVSLPPEFIVPQDGSDKQDCELNASQRWLEKYSDPLASLVRSAYALPGTLFVFMV